MLLKTGKKKFNLLPQSFFLKVHDCLCPIERLPLLQDTLQASPSAPNTSSALNVRDRRQKGAPGLIQWVVRRLRQQSVKRLFNPVKVMTQSHQELLRVVFEWGWGLGCRSGRHGAEKMIVGVGTGKESYDS